MGNCVTPTPRADAPAPEGGARVGPANERRMRTRAALPDRWARPLGALWLAERGHAPERGGGERHVGGRRERARDRRWGHVGTRRDGQGSGGGVPGCAEPCRADINRDRAALEVCRGLCHAGPSLGCADLCCALQRRTRTLVKGLELKSYEEWLSWECLTWRKGSGGL